MDWTREGMFWLRAHRKLLGLPHARCQVQKETRGPRAVRKGLCHDPRGDCPQSLLFLTQVFGFSDRAVMVCWLLHVGHAVWCRVALWPRFCLHEATLFG